MAAEKTVQKLNYQFHIEKGTSTRVKKIQETASLAHYIVGEKNRQSK